MTESTEHAADASTEASIASTASTEADKIQSDFLKETNFILTKITDPVNACERLQTRIERRLEACARAKERKEVDFRERCARREEVLTEFPDIYKLFSRKYGQDFVDEFWGDTKVRITIGTHSFSVLLRELFQTC